MEGTMKQGINLCAAITLILFSGCASTSMTSFTDPAYRGTTFKRVLVVANVSDLEWRQKIETRIVQEFRSEGIYAMEGINLFPPTRAFTDSQKVELLVQNNIDSYIVIGVGESGIQQVYIPQTGSSTKTEGRVDVYGNTATYEEKSTTRTYGGYNVSKPWAHFDAKLYDVSRGDIAWVASATTGGNAYANFNTVVNSFCGKTVEQLIKDGVVRKGVRQ
jgi:hypothetical protein